MSKYCKARDYVKHLTLLLIFAIILKGKNEIRKPGLASINNLPNDMLLVRPKALKYKLPNAKAYQLQHLAQYKVNVFCTTCK